MIYINKIYDQFQHLEQSKFTNNQLSIENELSCLLELISTIDPKLSYKIEALDTHTCFKFIGEDTEKVPKQLIFDIKQIAKNLFGNIFPVELEVEPLESNYGISVSTTPQLALYHMEFIKSIAKAENMESDRFFFKEISKKIEIKANDLDQELLNKLCATINSLRESEDWKVVCRSWQEKNASTYKHPNKEEGEPLS